MSFHKSGQYAVNMGLDSDNVLRIGGWSASANRWQLDMSGNTYVAGSSRAPIFYDQDNTGYYADLAGDVFAYRVYGAADSRSPIFYDYNNTGYYCDPASTSNFNAVTCISLTETSSERYKENIYTLDNALDKVSRLRGVSYNRKGSKTQEIGVIAEEIASVIPEVLKYNVDGEPDSVSYGRITALLIEAIKELKQEIEILKQK